MDDFPTLTVKDATLIPPDPFFMAGYDTIGAHAAELPDGEYALVRKDKLERVWWCDEHQSSSRDAACDKAWARHIFSQPEPCPDQQARWLVRGGDPALEVKS